MIESLLRIAEQLTRDCALGPNYVALHEALGAVRQISDSERGVKRALAEVAEGFLRMQLRGHTGRRDLFVHRFLRADDIKGSRRALLRAALSANGCAPPPTVALTDELLDEGVLRRGLEGRLWVTRDMRRCVQDAVDPPVMKHWEWMHTVREQAAGTADPVSTIAGNLGCTRDEAQDHLRRFPLPERT